MICLVLPVPPSVNEWKAPAVTRGARRKPGGRFGPKLYMRKTPKYGRYAGEVQIAWARQMPRGTKPLAGPIGLVVRWYRARAAGDLDGRLKALCDALNGLAWIDDAQIEEIHAYRYEDKAKPRIEVEIAELWQSGAVAPPEVREGQLIAKPATYRAP